MQYQKVKDVAKVVMPKGEALTERTLRTMKTVADIVGSTLGPGGSSVLIERQEIGMPSIVTKDGVTVFRSLSFDDPIMHEIMAAARDASVRTADSAGDGTTTATILADAIIRNAHRYLKNHPDARPQKVVREMESAFKKVIEPTLRAAATPVDISTEEGRKLAHAVAKVSANGDVELADTVLECFDVVGDDGNVTLIEASGPSGYKAEALKGYPITTGYEESCGRFFSMFINDTANQRVHMERTVFLLYYGNIVDIQSVLPIMMKVAHAWENDGYTHNVVLAATGFSEQVLGSLAVNWEHPGAINVYPLLVPRTIEQEGSQKILEDLAAYTGATLFNPITRPLDTAELQDLGIPMEYFEATRTRSTIVGEGDEVLILDRVNDLKVQAENAVSVLDRSYIEERIGKLTGGIAKLTVYGSSTGELREKRDRAEDAVMAVRGAMKHGVLPAGGWGLIKVIHALEEAYPNYEGNKVIHDVLVPALEAPILRLLSNIGLNDEEQDEVISRLNSKIAEGMNHIYDAWEGKFVDAFEAGLLDSLPAVLEAIRNSLSIASLLGTLGGAVVYKRDHQLEREEARSAMEFVRNANTDAATYRSEADERG